MKEIAIFFMYIIGSLILLFLNYLYRNNIINGWIALILTSIVSCLVFIISKKTRK